MSFIYIKSKNINDVKEKLIVFQEKNPVILAGGSDLIIGIKTGSVKPEVVIDISKVEELAFIEEKGDEILIGAGVTFSDILDSDILKIKFPSLQQGALKLGSPQIRSVATIGGNVCNASPCGDSFPPLAVHEAKAIIISGDKEKEIPVENFFVGRKATILKKNEFLKGFRVKALKPGEKSGFLNLGQRNATVITKVSCAAKWTEENNGIKSIKIAFGSVAPTVLRAVKTEEFLTGKKLTDENIKAAAIMASEEVRPITDIRSTKEYRRQTAGVLLKRILTNS